MNLYMCTTVASNDVDDECIQTGLVFAESERDAERQAQNDLEAELADDDWRIIPIHTLEVAHRILQRAAVEVLGNTDIQFP